MINIGLYSHSIDFAGTWRSHERIAEELQEDSRFKVFIFYSPIADNNRLETSKNILNKCEFIPFERTHDKLGPSEGWRPHKDNIAQIVKEKNIQIFHFARSGYFEWPFISRICPVQIETNIFGYGDDSPFLDGSIVISKCLKIDESTTKKVIPIAIPMPKLPLTTTLRKQLGIGEEELVFGRIGRPDNFAPIALAAYKKFINHYQKKSKYIIVGPCKAAKDYIISNDLSNNVIMIECTNDDEFIEKFNNTIDIFAHYRSDGETFGTAIAQAMMHGKPVITHFAGQNGQLEIIGNSGFCVNSIDDYYQRMIYLSDKENLNNLSDNAKKIAINNFEQKTVVNKITDFYLKMLRNKI